VALFVAALSFNVAAQDNAEKVKERIMPLIDGKVSVPEQEELFSSLIFGDGKLISFNYDGLENNLPPQEFDKVLLVMINKSFAIIVEDGNSRPIGTPPTGGTGSIPVNDALFFNLRVIPSPSGYNLCEFKNKSVCVRRILN
ncbi:MAG: hypothetical protein ACLGGV_07045, partial [Bacteroidia bacterium]